MRSLILILTQTRSITKGCGCPKYRVKGLAQSQVAGTDVRMQPVLAVAAFVERAEKAPMVLVKGWRLQPSSDHGRVHVGIIRRVSHMNDQFSSVKLNVLVPRDVADFQFTCGHPNVEAGILWNLHGDLNVVPGAT